MFMLKRSGFEIRSNRAVTAAERRRQTAAGDSYRMAPEWRPRMAGGRPSLLARMARAAREAVREARSSGDVPLPHLYRGRDFDKERDAHAA